VQFSVQNFTLSNGTTIVPDSTTVTVAGGGADIGQSLTVPILVSGTAVPEPNQLLLIVSGFILILGARLRGRRLAPALSAKDPGLDLTWPAYGPKPGSREVKIEVRDHVRLSELETQSGGRAK
jgi:hypothetical protein